MATKKREIYARMAVQLRTHERPAIAEEICPGAMGLYLFLTLQARGEETHGETLEAIAYSSWGTLTPYRRKQAKALIAAGLVEVLEGRLVVSKYLDHNDGPEEIAANKASANKRRKECDERRKVVPLTTDSRVSHASHSSSISCSLSGSADLEGSDLPTSTPREVPPDPPSRPHNDSETPCAIPISLVELGQPPWWEAACDTVAANVAPVDNRGARWLEYDASRERKGFARSQRDAVGWLSTVVRSERTRAPASRRVDTRQPLIGPEPEWLTRAKSTGTDGTEPF